MQKQRHLYQIEECSKELKYFIYITGGYKIAANE